HLYGSAKDGSILVNTDCVSPIFPKPLPTFKLKFVMLVAKSQFLFGAKTCSSDRNMFLMLHDSLKNS
ncbi:MAG: hypothetical protein ACK556_22010, partial [Pseudanabaena sp.]